MKKRGKTILNSDQIHRTIDRLSYELIEHHGDFSDSYIVGIQLKGVLLAERLIRRIKEIAGIQQISFGKLDITFFRDDFRRNQKIIQAHETDMDFLVEGKKVILVDDVLYSGRTINAGLQALQQFGRPSKVELLVLIDRRFNRHLPIQADYIGQRVDALDEAYVKVNMMEEDGEDKVLFYDADRTEL